MVGRQKAVMIERQIAKRCVDPAGHDHEPSKKMLKMSTFSQGLCRRVGKRLLDQPAHASRLVLRSRA
jgi:hypothetical protein